MKVVGYARVSTDHQLLDGQRDALGQARCGRVFTDQLVAGFGVCRATIYRALAGEPAVAS